MKEFLKKELYSFRAVAAILARWLLLAVPTGLVCGAVGTAFHLAVEHVTEWRAEHIWLLWLLPVAGLAIVALYKVTGCEGMGTNNVIRAVHSGESVSPLLVPAIFFGTVLTMKYLTKTEVSWLYFIQISTPVPENVQVHG